MSVRKPDNVSSTPNVLVAFASVAQIFIEKTASVCPSSSRTNPAPFLVSVWSMLNARWLRLMRWVVLQIEKPHPVSVSWEKQIFCILSQCLYTSKYKLCIHSFWWFLYFELDPVLFQQGVKDCGMGLYLYIYSSDDILALCVQRQDRWNFKTPECIMSLMFQKKGIKHKQIEDHLTLERGTLS